MSSSPTEDAKLRGGYYTPARVADWLANWAIRSTFDRVLEPSCGDGSFLAAAARRLVRLRATWPSAESQLVGIELIREEAAKSVVRANGMAEIAVIDFFAWLETAELATFDVVLGNPPFIRYQNFPESSRGKAMRFMESQGLRPNRLTNIWVPFVVAATSLLRERGRMAMVLPAELLQVSYAGQLRQFLVDSFSRITVFACNEMFFEGAEQEVVLLAAEGKRAKAASENRCDVSLHEARTLDALLGKAAKTTRKKADAKFVQHDTEKWLKYFLSGREIEFMRALRDNARVGTLRDHAEVDVGVVTGKNEFFVVSRDEIHEFELAEHVVPLVGRSAQLAGTVLRESEHRAMQTEGKRVFLLNVTLDPSTQFPSGLRAFIERGERLGWHRGYKCRTRAPWFRVPAPWIPDCFVFRQIYDFPRVVVNKAGATSTDTIHRMRCKGPRARVAANLYTHLTAASAEIEGRSYGGGVLELEPTEAERLLFPKRLNGAMPVEDADRLVRDGRLNDVLIHNDCVVLQHELGFSRNECATLKGIWAKLRNRRMARRRS